jgi:NAD(P)-dependent dehydrogenase (short-subunit alcohol dehydrogenase family)
VVARWDERRVPALDGRVALVTGANSGLGLELSKVLVRHGAEVILACRNTEKAEAAAEQVRQVGRGQAEVVPLDLASLQSVAGAARQVCEKRPELHLLVNNAGLMAIDRSQTEEGFETQFGVNHLGHFALTAHLMPTLLNTAGSRIVNVSSMGHRAGTVDLDDLMFERRGYRRWPPYFQSKLANLLFTTELDRRLRVAHATTMALSAHPGFSRTDLGFEGSGFTNLAAKPFSIFGQPAWLGALPIIRAATDPEARSGQYYGPQFMVFGYPTLETPSRQARDAQTARRLWERSEELTGVNFDIPTTAGAG